MASGWFAGVAVWTEDAADSSAVHSAACQTQRGRAVVAAVSIERKAFACHALEAAACDAVLAQLRVLLDDFQWRDDHLQAHDLRIVHIHTNPASFSKELDRFALERGHQVLNPTSETLVDPELMEEAVEKLLQPRSTTQWTRTRAALGSVGFHHCVAALYSIVRAAEVILENSRLENAFQFTLQVHSQPVRDYMRLNDTARRMTRQPLTSLFRPFCRTKQGLKYLLARLDRPELDADVLHRWHELLDELVRSSDECKTAVAALLDCVAAAEGRLLLNSSSTPSTLEDFRRFCHRARQIQASCRAFLQASATSVTPLLHTTLASQMTTVADEVVMPFVEEIEVKIKLFEATHVQTTATADQTAELCVQSLRGQVRTCERSIQTHRDEVAATLLLQPERIKIVFEDDDFSSAAAKATRVLFRVTRQDAHRVFKANAVGTDQTAKTRRRITTSSTSTTAVTLVYSRRTTGVWFSTPRLDALAVQWRTLRLEISRLETQLIASLMELYDREVRAELVEWLSLVSQLDVLAAFTRATSQYGFTRATTVDTTHKMELTDLHWPWGVPATDSLTNVTSTSLRLDATHPLLTVHSAIDGDGSLPTRAALAVVLHQIGCFVPCSQALLPLVDALFVRAGATDQTLAHESTFLSEMQQMNTILTRATRRSLVVVDELCRGTSPAEGLPLAVEICRFLAEKRVFTCVATQWTELLDALLKLDQATVPTALTDPSNASKQAYTQRLRDCDQRFLSTLYDQDFPSELINLIENDLHDSPATT